MEPQLPLSSDRPQPPTSSQTSTRQGIHHLVDNNTTSTTSTTSLPQQRQLQRSPLSPSRHSEDASRRRVPRWKLHKRQLSRHPNMDFPEQLKRKEGDEEQEEDVLPVGLGRPNRPIMNLNQSIFGLIAAAGPKVDFHDRFEGHSSEEEAEDSDGHGVGRRPGNDGAKDPMAQTTILRKPGSKSTERHRRKFSDSKLMKSVPILSRLSTKSRSRKDGKKPAIQIQEESEPESPVWDGPSISLPNDENRLAPVMSRMLEARAEVSARPSFDLERRSIDKSGEPSGLTETAPSDLSKRLQKIFEFDEPEELISEYPCWLLQGVLLQGYIYITSRHICFYAYLPKKAVSQAEPNPERTTLTIYQHEVTKSGYLSKSGKRNPKYNRYWFRLKGDVFSYFRDPSNLYFPHGQIDLRYGISASITDKDKEGVHFSVETDHRTYHFRADSAPSANEWVKCLQKVIFRSHNDGDSVKIRLPIANVIDIEEAQMLELADTCKIRVIDNDETYAIDEYFFSFFSFGKEAIGVLKILIEDVQSRDHDSEGKKADSPPTAHNNTRPTVPFARQSSHSGDRTGLVTPPKGKTGKLQGNVKATLSPRSPQSPAGSSPRASGEYFRRNYDTTQQSGGRSMDINQGESPRRSFSRTGRSTSRRRLSNRISGADKYITTDSYADSTEDPSIASMSAMTTSGELDESASQILRGSDVFHSPTVHRSASASRGKGREFSSSPHRHISTEPLGDHYGPHHGATTSNITDPSSGEHGEPNPPTPTLQTISKMGSYPLQRVGAFAEYLGRHSKRVGGLLATESIGYAGKVSGMWKGGQRHYDEPNALRADDGGDADEQDRISEERFQAHFALPRTERLKATYFGYFMRVLPLYGKVYLSDRTFCFRSLMPGTRTKLILPIRDIENVTKSSGFRLGYAGLVVVIRGHEELFFEFGDSALRDNLAIFLLKGLETAKSLRESQGMDSDEQEDAENAVAEHKALEQARHEEFPPEFTLPRHNTGMSDGPTIIFDDPKASFINFKPEKSLRITCLTIGSRGDVQPYIALCKGLMAEGHKAKIATHMEFKDWIENHGIEFAPVEGDPGELMRLCIENGTFTVSFLREASSTMRTWLDGLLASSWQACKGSDVLIESPSAMAGIHIAEKLCIPYFRAFGMPWTRTRAYPQAFMMPERKMGGAYNLVTYILFDAVFWKATAHQINRWRNQTLGLPNTSLEKMQPNKVPFLYNFSQHVVPPPLDYSDWIRVTGYWFLNEGSDNWKPDQDLVDFIDKARKDKKKLVYVGFGSIIMDNPAKFTREIIAAVQKADVRCILSKGWSDRLDPKSAEAQEVGITADIDSSADASSEGKGGLIEIPLPPEIFSIKSAPHDWLFKQIDAAAHHGGSGTTGASLRAGIPTIVRPFFGDQFFFGGRVEDLGVGILLKKWGVNSFARALWEATHSERMIAKARGLGENIRKENGVDTAIQCIYRDMEYAKSLIEKKAGKNAAAAERAATTGSVGDMDDDVEEESWTFIGDDTSPEDDGDVEIDAIMKRSQFLASFSDAAKPQALGSKTLNSTMLYTGDTMPGSKASGQRGSAGPRRSGSSESIKEGL